MWADEQAWERDWWGDCTNTLDEELKQLSYFKRLGLVETKNAKTRFVFDMQGKSVLDIGGGPCSFLLKCKNVEGIVCDPCSYPEWVYTRYRAAHIGYAYLKGEDITWDSFDEVWIYNVLQHVEDPQKVIENAKKAGKLIRFFDWIDTPAMPGHPHTLKERLLNHWLGGEGIVEEINENGAKGRCYYGVFEVETKKEKEHEVSTQSIA